MTLPASTAPQFADLAKRLEDNFYLYRAFLNRFVSETPPYLHADVESDLLMSYWRACRNYTPEMGVPLDTYIYRCATNAYRMLLRRAQREARRIVLLPARVRQNDDSGLVSTLGRTSASTPDYSEIALARVLLFQAFREVRTRFPRHELQAWFDHMIIGLQQDEIAAVLGVSQPMVSRWIRTVNQTLAAIIGREARGHGRGRLLRTAPSPKPRPAPP